MGSELKTDDSEQKTVSSTQHPAAEKNQDLKSQRVSVVIHTVFGLLAGYLSLYFSRFWFALGASIILLLVVGLITQKTYAKGKDRKWWLGNGVAIYILVWLMAWILLLNLVPIPPKIV